MPNPEYYWELSQPFAYFQPECPEIVARVGLVGPPQTATTATRVGPAAAATGSWLAFNYRYDSEPGLVFLFLVALERFEPFWEGALRNSTQRSLTECSFSGLVAGSHPMAAPSYIRAARSWLRARAGLGCHCGLDRLAGTRYISAHSRRARPAAYGRPGRQGFPIDPARSSSLF